MQYQHIHHAGNFADVLKHAVLARIISQLQTSDAAIRVIDTHAGAGIYDLALQEAGRSGGWQDGIGRLLSARLPEDADRLLEPYLSVVRALNPGDSLSRYPGSPKLARALLRKQDRLSAIESHKQQSEALRDLFEGDYQTRVTTLDGWLALGAHLPPKERRGVVLVDPPFEIEGAYDRLVDGLARAYSLWPSGLYCLSYPVMAGAPVADFHGKLRALGIPKILCAELRVCDGTETDGLAGSGIILVNAPAKLEKELAALLPVLETSLARTPRSGCSIFRVAGERQISREHA
ncbi:23S rRNA (adenine(2030)-N(6))-methyltransferase RlmJ [Hoeflea poritis]|uniref:Ribosomal RNA large subunit methyltransferase J n=1 Tax=Hoeflea poritis TaxID=2993659 RepID=A0ABT4VS16_9HYPH|nr:23S rRNA (adenine(2030)-N(6))-methyltransferase RlmJ [Hoeflea poritis]MDA4846990.1 23S rRNA (adenine(2030)-N(6))-methyltransferase RlmJ [Hoeflea poritis]